MKSTETITIVHGIPESMRKDAAVLYDEAIGEKFSRVISSKPLRQKLLTGVLDLSCAFAAIDEDRLVGVAGYKTHEGSFTGGLTVKQLFKELGVWQAIWAIMIFSLYERTIKPGELLMDGIVVCRSDRGRGIGGKLLERLCLFAKEHHYQYVRLDVIDTNPGAKRMYLRHGFEPVKTERFEFLRGFLGFGASTTLLRKV
jgi:ribosomal protein S18 acetylase RimI-like enzyme